MVITQISYMGKNEFCKLLERLGKEDVAKQLKMDKYPVEFRMVMPDTDTVETVEQININQEG